MGTHLTGRTVLIAPSDSQCRDLSAELERYRARVITCPKFEPTESESYAALDEAIENLYGYDWLIFTTVSSVEYFLRRCQHLNREIQELDSLRVCAITHAAVRQLEQSQVHVDLIPQQFKPADTFAALANFVGGAENLRGLNFLIPRASIGRARLKDLLEDTGARVDVAAYRTVSGINSELARINTLLAGGGIDCIAFTSASTVRDFAQLFDTNDLSELLTNVAVGCIDVNTAQTAAEFGLHSEIIPSDLTTAGFAHAIVEHFTN